MGNQICGECGERHPFYGTCIACQREHCDCWDSASCEREQAIEALLGAVGGARVNGESLFDVNVQRHQIGKFVDLVIAMTANRNPT